LGAKMMEIAQFYVEAYAKMYPGIEGCGLHDPLAVAIAEDPSLATFERMCVDVELNGALTRGQTVADRRRTAVERTNADVCIAVDADRFADRFVEALA
jgi:purine nucleosidase